jgi:hypothetical protein
MLFIALAKFKTTVTEEIVARNLKDIETDAEGRVRYLGSTGRPDGRTPSSCSKPWMKKQR